MHSPIAPRIKPLFRAALIFSNGKIGNVNSREFLSYIFNFSMNHIFTPFTFIHSFTEIRMTNYNLTEQEIMLFLQAYRLNHSLTKRAFSELLEFVAVLADKTEGPLSSVHKFDAKFDALNQNTVDEKTVKLFFAQCVLSHTQRGWRDIVAAVIH